MREGAAAGEGVTAGEGAAGAAATMTAGGAGTGEMGKVATTGEAAIAGAAGTVATGEAAGTVAGGDGEAAIGLVRAGADPTGAEGRAFRRLLVRPSSASLKGLGMGKAALYWGAVMGLAGAAGVGAAHL